ncbi:hypothetical protein D3C71_1383240 [compost metagenome]
MIWSPEQSMIGEPVAADAATAAGRNVPNTMANVAARKASERVRLQDCAADRDTGPP